MTRDGIRAVELRPTWGSIYVIDSYTGGGTISFEMDLGIIELHKNRHQQETHLAETYPSYTEIVALALDIQDQARPRVMAYDDALAEITLWRPSKSNVEFFATCIELHPETHPDGWDTCRHARSLYWGEYGTWSEFAIDFNGDEDETDRSGEDELRYLYEESHGHFFRRRGH